jgi:hypothetical protein
MNNNISVVVAPSWELAQTIQDPTITVEAEWGGIVLEGSAFTACHHQPGQESWPAPCNNTSIPTIEQGTIVLSHLDHDCIAGTLRAMGCAELFTPEFNSFWQLAEDCDKNGPKVLKDHSQEDQDRMNAIWAHLKTLPFTPRDKIKDVTETILKCREVFRKILNGDETLLNVGRQWVEYNKALDTNSFVSSNNGVQKRIITELDPATGRPGFVNHLYGDDIAIATFVEPLGTITISIKDPIEGVSCREIMQALHGMEAGGHDGIAGGRREGGHSMEQFENTYNSLLEAVSAAS